MLNSARPKPAQPGAAPWSPSSRDPRMSLSLSLSWNLCPIFKNKYNTNKRSLDYSHHPRTDATTLESTTTKISRFQRGPRHPGYSEEENTSRNGWEALRTTKSSTRWLAGRPAHAGDLLMTLGWLQAARYERRVCLRPASKQHVGDVRPCQALGSAGPRGRSPPDSP